MIQPEPLKHETPWLWSPGRGTDTWALFLACRAGDLAQVRRLVDSDPALVRAHFEYRTPLAFAVRANRLDVVRFLLERGAPPLALGDVVEDARDRGLDEMTRLLEAWLAERCNASPAGEPVAAAIRSRNRRRVAALLDASPALLHAGDRRSCQPIHWAVMTRQLRLIDDLLERGADIDARREDGARPIQLTNGDCFHRGWRDVPVWVRTRTMTSCARGSGCRRPCSPSTATSHVLARSSTPTRRSRTIPKRWSTRQAADTASSSR